MIKLRALRLLAIILPLSVGAMRPPPALAQVPIAAMTVGGVISSLQETISNLEEEAHSLLQQGNVALAQQQVLAAGILKQLVTQLGDTYKGSLDETFGKVSVAQANLAGDITSTLQEIQGLEKSTAADAQGTVYRLQSSVNHIVGELPFTTREPAFYGMVVHDVYSDLPKVGFDVELVGLNLADPDLGFKKPELTIGQDQIPPENISVLEDRVQVLIPKSIKDKIQIAEDACQPPSSFAMQMKVFYRARKSFLLVPYHSETSTTFTAFALQARELYVADTTISGASSKTNDNTYTFSKRSGEIDYECEATNGGGVNYALPNKATQVDCKASWVDQVSTKAQSASCAVGGTTVTATGIATGRDRQCIVSDILSLGLFKHLVGRHTSCNCPGGGHGWLLLEGTYHLPSTTESKFDKVAAGSQRFVEAADLAVPSDESKHVNEIDVVVHRPQCSTTLDEVDINLPTDATAVTNQTSKNGMFKATYRAEMLHLGRTD